MIDTAGNAGALAWFDAIGVVISMNIVFWFTWSLYYMVSQIKLLRKRNKKVYFTTYFNTGVSALFVVVFWYIIIATPLKGGVIDSTSFGAIVIRPLILLEAVGTTIHARESYERERSLRD